MAVAGDAAAISPDCCQDGYFLAQAGVCVICVMQPVFEARLHETLEPGRITTALSAVSTHQEFTRAQKQELLHFRMIFYMCCLPCADQSLSISCHIDDIPV
ncbi:hypothetical protein [Noviherbaspirillum saxi]|uniref:Uncharacterized protein n=1 Tax=Noviherbaspirillum saxi TaxID=2320863 RepID=A0A3A3FRM6_9BURK|nr:hypothetical protein [Noviherbaspirillum saxi]RJF96102.1 hypothetical protein D3871_22460 [Noviherbaspirillum saxi]